MDATSIFGTKQVVKQESIPEWWKENLNYAQLVEIARQDAIREETEKIRQAEIEQSILDAGYYILLW